MLGGKNVDVVATVSVSPVVNEIGDEAKAVVVPFSSTTSTCIITSF